MRTRVCKNSIARYKKVIMFMYLVFLRKVIVISVLLCIYTGIANFKKLDL